MATSTGQAPTVRGILGLKLKCLQSETVMLNIRRERLIATVLIDVKSQNVIMLTVRSLLNGFPSDLVAS